jgi:hypothetical protein
LPFASTALRIEELSNIEADGAIPSFRGNRVISLKNPQATGETMVNMNI